MKITIDTKEDNPADIRKVMEILSHFVKKDSVIPNEPVDTSNMMNMFSSDQSVESSASTPEPETRGTAPDFSSYLNLANEDKKKPKIQFL